MLELMRGGWAEFRQRGRIYRLAVPVLKKAYNLVISSRSRAGTAKKFEKKRGARAELLFCLQNLLLFDVTVAVAVTVIVSQSAFRIRADITVLMCEKKRYPVFVFVPAKKLSDV